jgi:hypothetical protein
MLYTYLLKPLVLGVALALVNPFSSGAQKAGGGRFSFTWGEEYQLPKRHDDLGFIGNTHDGYIQISHDQRESLIFQKFDAKLQLKGETESDLSKLPKSYRSELITQIGSEYYWFFSTWDKGEDRESLYAQEIDPQAGKMKGSAREIASSTKLASFFGNSKWNFFYSFDQSKILVEYRKKPERRNDNKSNDVIGFQVYDDQMKQLWGREIRMPYTEAKMDNEDYSVDSRGNIYMLAKVYDETKGDRKRPNHHFEILKWTKDKTEVAIIPFKFTDKFVNSAYITEDGNGSIVIGGYYTNRRNSGSTDGIFLLKLDDNTNEMKNVMKGIYPFPVNVMKQYESARTRRRMERKEEKGEVEDANLVLRSVIMKADGSIQVLGEESYSVTTTYYNGRTTHTRTTYYYNDIMAMEIGSDGEMRWVKKIPKSQAGMSRRGGMSFKSFNYNGDTYFFFMDHKKNLDIKKDETPATHSDGAGGILMAVRIDQDGNMKKDAIFDVREDKLTLTVSDFKRVDNHQIMVRGRAKKRNSQAALITFE